MLLYGHVQSHHTEHNDTESIPGKLLYIVSLIAAQKVAIVIYIEMSK